MNVRIGVSNRHIHLTKESVEVLFGKDYELQKLKDLYQPGQFAASSQVTIKTEKGEIRKVRVIGPVRAYNQVEISRTDAYQLGINPPVRESSYTKDSSPITVIGECGEITLEEGCILATRHIHMPRVLLDTLGLKEDSLVSIHVGGPKAGTLENVSLRVSDDCKLEMHIDTDDANAHLIQNGDEGDLIISDH